MMETSASEKQTKLGDDWGNRWKTSFGSSSSTSRGGRKVGALTKGGVLLGLTGRGCCSLGLEVDLVSLHRIYAYMYSLARVQPSTVRRYIMLVRFTTHPPVRSRGASLVSTPPSPSLLRDPQLRTVNQTHTLQKRLSTEF